MIIVLLLFFQSICRYCQRLVLHIYDRWINPKNARLQKEAAELTGNRKLLQQPTTEQPKRNKKRYTATSSGNTSGFLLSESCRFCANTPQGYCRHHFHLQELEIQKQQQRGWNLLSERESEYRQWRKANRELKRNLKNRLLIQQQQQEQSQQQLRRQRTQTFYGEDNSGGDGVVSFETTSTTSSTLYDSGYQSANSSSTTTYSTEQLTSSSVNTPNGNSVETIYYFESSLETPSSPSTATSSELSGSYVAHSISVPVSLSTTYL